METKEQLISTIKDWMKYDDEIKLLQKEIRNRKQIKKDITDNLVSVMTTNDIDEFDINNGKLSLVKKKTKWGFELVKLGPYFLIVLLYQKKMLLESWVKALKLP